MASNIPPGHDHDSLFSLCQNNPKEFNALMQSQITDDQHEYLQGIQLEVSNKAVAELTAGAFAKIVPTIEQARIQNQKGDLSKIVAIRTKSGDIKIIRNWFMRLIVFCFMKNSRVSKEDVMKEFADYFKSDDYKQTYEELSRMVKFENGNYPKLTELLSIAKPTPTETEETDETSEFKGVGQAFNAEKAYERIIRMASDYDMMTQIDGLDGEDGIASEYKEAILEAIDFFKSKVDPEKDRIANGFLIGLESIQARLNKES